MTQVTNDGLFWDEQIHGFTSAYYKLIDEKDLRGIWHAIKMYIKWSKNDDGIMKIWVNDELKFDYKGKNCHKKTVYFKYGVYRSFMSRYKNKYGVDEVPAQIVYYANVKRTKSEEKLNP
jgi:hypothetical protein